MDAREHLLDEAKAIVTGARPEQYGAPESNFGRIASLWNAYLLGCGHISAVRGGSLLSPRDVAAMMILMKIARLEETPNHHDSVVDIAGYAACYAACMEQA